MFIPSLRQSKLLWNLLTSSGKSCFNHACYEYVSRRPPPLRTATFIPSICRIYIYKFRIVIGLHLDMQTRPLVYALYPVSVRQTGTLPPPHGGHPCPWLTIPTIKARSGLTPYSCCPCRANMYLPFSHNENMKNGSSEFDKLCTYSQIFLFSYEAIC